MSESPHQQSGILHPSNTTYDRLKTSATVILPAVGALYFALAQIWGFPKAEEVVGTTAAINTFLGLFIVKAAKNYNRSDDRYAGVMVSEDSSDGEKKTISLILHDDPENLEKQNEVTFKVRNNGTTK